MLSGMDGAEYGRCYWFDSVSIMLRKECALINMRLRIAISKHLLTLQSHSPMFVVR